MKVFEDYAYYYNLFYGDKDYIQEAKYIHDLIQKNNNKSKSLLNLGCGTGRHDLEFNKLGYTVHGIDLSDNMIKQALKNNIKDNLTFEVADIRNYKSNKKYDVVTSLFHVMSYQWINEDLEAAFRTAYNHLEKEGLFMFDCWYGPGVLTDRPAVRVKRIEDENYHVIRIAEPEMNAEKNLVHVNYQILVTEKETGITKEIKETHRMRYLFTPEVEYILNRIGFKNVRTYEYGNENKPTYKSWNAVFIASK